MNCRRFRLLIIYKFISYSFSAQFAHIKCYFSCFLPDNVMLKFIKISLFFAKFNPINFHNFLNPVSKGVCFPGSLEHGCICRPCSPFCPGLAGQSHHHHEPHHHRHHHEPHDEEHLFHPAGCQVAILALVKLPSRCPQPLQVTFLLI